MWGVVCQGDGAIVKLMVREAGGAGLRSRHRAKILDQGWATQLTWKSTEAHILSLERRGQLVPFEPGLVQGKAYRRRLWLHLALAKWVATQGLDASQQRYFEGVRALLKAFVTGGDFDDDELLWELTTNLGSWYEFRITFHPQHRILGGFLRPGEFIALAHGTRKDLDKKGFAPTISRAAKLWKSLSFGSRPLTTTRSSLLEDFHHDED